MTPVFPNETKYSRARFAAQLHVQGTMLSAEALLEVCEEFLRLSELVAKYGALHASRIEKGTHCEHGNLKAPGFKCDRCTEEEWKAREARK